MTRISDMASTENTGGDFTLRTNKALLPIMASMLVVFCTTFLCGLGLQSGWDLWLFGALTIIILAALAGFIWFYLQRQQDLISLTEFQNSLFASAARLNWHFYLILHKDGSVAYIDPGFRELFPDLPVRSLTDVSSLGAHRILDAEHQRIFDNALRNRESAQIVTTLQDAAASSQKVIISLDPLPRPSGYFALRGRPFVERTAPRSTTHKDISVVLPASTPPSPSSASVALRFQVETLSIPSAWVDQYGIVQQCNEAFRLITHRTRHKREGWNVLEAISPAYRAEISSLLSRITPDSPIAPPLDIRLVAEAQEDAEHAASLYLSCISEQGAAAPLFLLQLLDTSEQKNLELKYAHSQKMQAVGQLAGGVAHDFNNLLTAMIGFCDLLLMRHPAGDLSFPDIMQIKQNANRAANLVRQLLAFSRRQTLQPKLLDMTEVLAELSNLIRRLIGENIELKVVHGRDIGMVKADQGQLEQVLINLAVNARDAMSQSGGMLTLRTSAITIRSPQDLGRELISPADEDQIVAGGYTLVEIADTGTGIPQENIQKIFEPFFSTKEVGAGTGLGLATVYGIIKQTGGYVYVASQLGVGTRFQLYFPRYEAETEQVVTEQKQEREQTGDLTGMGTILLVEDEAPVRNFAARALRNKGYTVLEADCGEAALEVIAEQGKAIDIIVSDVIMPGMNGPEMIKKIMPDYPHIRVIFISGYAEDAFADSFGEDYKFNFLPKPFTLKQLAGKVKEVISGES